MSTLARQSTRKARPRAPQPLTAEVSTPAPSHPSDDLLVGLQAGVLFTADETAVEKHLAGCRTCRTRYAALSGTPEDAPPAEVPPPMMAPTAPAAQLTQPSRQARFAPGVLASVAKRLVVVLALFGIAAGAGVVGRREVTRRNDVPLELAAAPAAPRRTPPPVLVALPVPAEALVVDTEKVEAAAAAAASTTPEPEPLVVTSPNRNFRWRVMGDAVERTSDNGRRWRKQQVQLRSTVAAGTAPSAAVCWLVGAKGLVLTAVGSDWKQVASPGQVDLVQVAAIDSTNATVTAADGRQFTTSDGGASWAQVQ